MLKTGMVMLDAAGDFGALFAFGRKDANPAFI